jgi:hypothetical protein
MIINCPHCNIPVEVLEMNCRIFRCGIYKKGFKQIDPHMIKEDCDRLARDGVIYGCGKPFKVNLIERIDGSCSVVACDYI